MPKRKQKSRPGPRPVRTRREVEPVLRSDFKLEVKGFYAWLRSQKAIRAELGRMWTPTQGATRHARKCQAHPLQCKQCAVWGVLVDCWRVASQLHHAMAATTEHLADLRAKVRETMATVFGRAGGLYWPALAEIRKHPLGIHREDGELLHAPPRLVRASQVFVLEIMALERAITKNLDPAVSTRVHKAGEQLLVNKVCFDLSQAGFSNPEIAEMLSEIQPLEDALKRAKKNAGRGARAEELEKKVNAEVAQDRRRASALISRRVRRDNALLREPA